MCSCHTKLSLNYVFNGFGGGGPAGGLFRVLKHLLIPPPFLSEAFYLDMFSKCLNFGLRDPDLILGPNLLPWLEAT